MVLNSSTRPSSFLRDSKTYMNFMFLFVFYSYCKLMCSRNFTTANTLTCYLIIIFLTNVILFEGTMRQTGFSTRLATSCPSCQLCLSCRGDLAWASVLALLPIWHYWATRCTPETSSYSWTTSHKRVLSNLSVKLWPHPSGKAPARGP